MRLFSLILTAGFTFAIPIANPPLNQRSVADTSFKSRSDVVQESKTLNPNEMQRANRLKRNDGLDNTVDWVKRGGSEYLNKKADRQFDGSTPEWSKKEVRS
ncbi:hypothetical protein B0O99DRAFT_691552 [Bisporella sp. PMI_857]|nr:hypothetical protein B0O99DRAFT_691552 [Bisporella sp. PMI_857]